MAGMSQYPVHLDDLARSENSVPDSYYLDLIRAVQEVGGKDCFATELGRVCPEIHCRWRGDCLGLSML